VTDIIESRIWVFVEQRHGRVAEVGLELLSKAIELGAPLEWKVAAVLIGSGLTSLAERILSYGVDEVLVADDPLLADYCSQSYVKAIEGSLRKFQPDIFLLGATAMGTDFGPRLAARLRTGLSAHCIDLEITAEGHLMSVVPGWGGNIMARVCCLCTQPQMATVMPGVFGLTADCPPKGKIIRIDPAISREDVTYRVLDIKHEEESGTGLQSAQTVVAGGWGIGNKSDWHYVEELSSALNGAVGATRPSVDEGWAGEKQMIGQSGITVRPKLYIGVGISGHMHHLVGIKEADLMVAINSDPNAAIFQHCDLGVVGDFREILPPLITAIKKHSTTGQEQD
jgi:electron transfer flavoprotein alpha subunit